MVGYYTRVFSVSYLYLTTHFQIGIEGFEKGYAWTCTLLKMTLLKWNLAVGFMDFKSYYWE